MCVWQNVWTQDIFHFPSRKSLAPNHLKLLWNNLYFEMVSSGNVLFYVVVLLLRNCRGGSGRSLEWARGETHWANTLHKIYLEIFRIEMLGKAFYSTCTNIDSSYILHNCIIRAHFLREKNMVIKYIRKIRFFFIRFILFLTGIHH